MADSKKKGSKSNQKELLKTYEIAMKSMAQSLEKMETDKLQALSLLAALALEAPEGELSASVGVLKTLKADFSVTWEADSDSIYITAVATQKPAEKEVKPDGV